MIMQLQYDQTYKDLHNYTKIYNKTLNMFANLSNVSSVIKCHLAL